MRKISLNSSEPVRCSCGGGGSGLWEQEAGAVAARWRVFSFRGTAAVVDGLANGEETGGIAVAAAMCDSSVHTSYENNTVISNQ